MHLKILKLQTEAGPFCVTCCYVTDLGLYIEIISCLQLLQRLLRTAAYCCVDQALPPQNYNPHHGNTTKKNAAELCQVRGNIHVHIHRRIEMRQPGKGLLVGLSLPVVHN